MYKNISTSFKFNIYLAASFSTINVSSSLPGFGQKLTSSSSSQKTKQINRLPSIMDCQPPPLTYPPPEIADLLSRAYENHSFPLIRPAIKTFFLRRVRQGLSYINQSQKKIRQLEAGLLNSMSEEDLKVTCERLERSCEVCKGGLVGRGFLRCKLSWKSNFVAYLSATDSVTQWLESASR